MYKQVRPSLRERDAPLWNDVLDSVAGVVGYNREDVTDAVLFRKMLTAVLEMNTSLPRRELEKFYG